MTGSPRTIGEDDDRYVPVQHTPDGGRTMWALLDTDLSVLVAGYDGIVETWALRDSAKHFAALLRELDSLRPSRRSAEWTVLP